MIPALDYANRALTACHESADACPSWEEIRMKLYQQHLDAGVKSGIDPRRDPKGFRAAGEAGLRSIRLTPFGIDFCETCLPLDTATFLAVQRRLSNGRPPAPPEDDPSSSGVAP